MMKYIISELDQFNKWFVNNSMCIYNMKKLLLHIHHFENSIVLAPLRAHSHQDMMCISLLTHVVIISINVFCNILDRFPFSPNSLGVGEAYVRSVQKCNMLALWQNSCKLMPFLVHMFIYIRCSNLFPIIFSFDPLCYLIITLGFLMVFTVVTLVK